MIKRKNKIMVKNDQFFAAHNSYMEFAREQWGFSETTLRGYSSYIKRFLTFLEENKCQSFDKITPLLLSNYVPWVVNFTPNSFHCILPAIKSFLKYLFEVKMVNMDYSYCFNYKLPNKRRFIHGYSTSEINSLIEASKLSRTSPKRDCAIILLAAYTGLRSTDILNLKLHNIFWQNEEIRISQNKTGKELYLPLLPIVGNALADYILNERPKTCSNHLFVRAIEPFSQLSMTGLTNIIKRRAKCAHIETCYQRPTGIKSFRRSVGLNLLEQNTSADLIREILGHQSENAIKSYLAIDINHLKKCGFSLLGIEVKRKELTYEGI